MVLLWPLKIKPDLLTCTERNFWSVWSNHIL